MFFKLTNNYSLFYNIYDVRFNTISDMEIDAVFSLNNTRPTFITQR